MGQRAQVFIPMYEPITGEVEGGVYLYTHWGADELPQTVIDAITSEAGRSRWDDPEYLARIIFCRMMGDGHNGTTGFGIGIAEHGDLDYPPIVVDTIKRCVTIKGLEFTFGALALAEDSGNPVRMGS